MTWASAFRLWRRGRPERRRTPDVDAPRALRPQALCFECSQPGAWSVGLADGRCAVGHRAGGLAGAPILPARRRLLGLQHVLVEVPGEAGGAVLVGGDVPAQGGGDAALGRDDADPGDDLLPGLVVPSACRTGELLEVVGGLGQSFGPGRLLAGRDGGEMDQDPAHRQRRVAFAAVGQGVGALQDPVCLPFRLRLPLVRSGTQSTAWACWGSRAA